MFHSMKLHVLGHVLRPYLCIACQFHEYNDFRLSFAFSFVVGFLYFLLKLLSKSIRNIWRTVRRIHVLILSRAVRVNDKR